MNAITISDWTYTRKPSVIASRRQPARLWKKGRWPRSVLCCAVGLEVSSNRGMALWRRRSSALIYDTLKPYAERLEMGHPAKMKAITAGKKKSDIIDARTIADLVRCDLLPGCYVFPPELRDLRRLMRYRQMMVRRIGVRMHNKTAGLLMESGVSFRKTKLQGREIYFADLIKSLEEVPESVKDLLLMSRAAKELFEGVQNQLVRRLLADAVLKQRVERLSSIDGVGAITALSWALKAGDPHRFASIADAVSYCGLTATLLRSSAGKQQRGPLSKQRNAYLQTTLIEAAKLAPRWNSQLAQLYAQQLQRGHANRATLQVARKLVAYLLAVDKNSQRFAGADSASAAKSKAEKEQRASSSGISGLREKIWQVRDCWSFLGVPIYRPMVTLRW